MLYLKKNMNNINIDFQQLFNSLLSELADREKEVLTKRYQLTFDVPQKNTLKQIGDDYGITRERVRQIEREAINKLVKQAKLDKYSSELDEVEKALTTFLERKGGAATEKSLIEEHAMKTYQFDGLHLNAYLFVFDNLVEGYNKVVENDSHNTHWVLGDVDHANILSLIDKTYGHLDNKASVTSQDDLFNSVNEDLLGQVDSAYLNSMLEKHEDVSINEIILSYLDITKKIEKNILDLWGLTHWADVKPKKLADKIHLVFIKEENPLHFKDVAERINGAGFDKKTICAATVHNELIANDEYVLIGRGIYAKKNWGYTPGTVADIIISVLLENTDPMSKEDIYQAVLKQRQVNPSTIYLSLINKAKFKKTESGLFGLNK